MVGVVLDWLFDMLCERALLWVGACLLWALQLGRRPLSEQMEHAIPNVVAGLALWAALILAAVEIT